jgi:uncharacterized protein YprB with RNaseH-like and TPR domain
MNGDLERLRRMRELQGNHPRQSFRIPGADALNHPAHTQGSPFLGLERRQTGAPQPIEALMNGVLRENAYGAGYVIPTVHDPDYRHGGRLLSGWLDQDLGAAAEFTAGALPSIDPRRCLFLDTETTGLSQGAGTLVFLIGVGFFTESGFEVHQYFLRDPAEEPAMLEALYGVIAAHDALVTFNGRSFDVPLLNSRYLLNRRRVHLEEMPNLDLLYPARKLWKRRLESCRLGHLEAEILGVERTEQDVPGWYIPQLYQDYVVTKDARDMTRVIYHNLMDVLSMVTLGAQLCETFVEPANKQLPGKDWLSLARWYERLGRSADAEAAYQSAFDAARRDEEMLIVIQHLTAFLKKQGKAQEAAPHLETWAALQPRAVEPRLELAKYHEWTSKDLAQAVRWTEDALTTVQAWGVSLIREGTVAEIEHRLDRLRRKIHV